MTLFRKTTYETMERSHQLIKINQNKAESLLAYLDLYPNLKDFINEVIELLKYKVGPTKEKEADKIDDDISNLLDKATKILKSDEANIEESVKDILFKIKSDVFERQKFSK